MVTRQGRCNAKVFSSLWIYSAGPSAPTSSFAQQPGAAPQQQPQQGERPAEQFQRAQQQQQQVAQQATGMGRGCRPPVLVMTAQQAIAAGAAQAVKAPFEPLTKEQADYLDAVLNTWEKHTGAIHQYQCTLSRWQYDPSMDPTAPR